MTIDHIIEHVRYCEQQNVAVMFADALAMARHIEAQAARIAELETERDALTHDLDRLSAADAEHCTALVAAEARARDARAVLVHVEAGLNCRGENMTAHYCPNCDNSLYRLREEIRAALAQSKVTP